MRIGMILSGPLPPTEGIGFYAWNLAKQLTRRGHTIHLITRGRAAPLKHWEVDGITIWEVPFFPFYPYHVHFHSIFVQGLIRKLEPDLDLLHLHSPLVQLPRTRLPSLVTIHSPMKTAAAHSPDGSFLGWLIKLQTPFSVQLEKRLFLQANRLVAVSGSVAQALSEYNVQPDRVTILGNGVDTEVFRPGEDQVQNGSPYILTAGRLVPGKGMDDLVQCARIVLESRPDVRFMIAGSGPLEGSLRAKIRELGLEENILLLGQISDRTEMLKLYQYASVYLHPSLYEGLPTVVLEAMACGKAVIATRVSGSVDLIDDEINGLLVPARRPEALTQAILRVLENPDLAVGLGSVARKMVCNKYTWQLVGDRYIKEYHILLEGHRL